MMQCLKPKLSEVELFYLFDRVTRLEMAANTTFSEVVEISSWGLKEKDIRDEFTKLNEKDQEQSVLIQELKEANEDLDQKVVKLNVNV